MFRVKAKTGKVDPPSEKAHSLIGQLHLPEQAPPTLIHKLCGNRGFAAMSLFGIDTLGVLELMSGKSTWLLPLLVGLA